MTTDVGALTVSVPTVVSAFTALATLVLGILGWFLNYMIHQLGKTLELLRDDLDDLESKLPEAESRIRLYREQEFREINAIISEVRRECAQCLKDRRDEHTHCVNTFGKFGGRLSKLEGEHGAQLAAAGKNSCV